MVDSDWETYCSSSGVLIADIANLGEDAFEFEILEWVECQWMLSYRELYWQMQEEVMLREDSYNGIINVRLGKFKKFVKK